MYRHKTYLEKNDMTGSSGGPDNFVYKIMDSRIRWNSKRTPWVL